MSFMQRQRDKMSSSALTNGLNGEFSTMSPACQSIKLHPKDPNPKHKVVAASNVASRSKLKANSRSKGNHTN